MSSELIICRLDPAVDRELFEIAYHWDENSPRWYRESDGIFRPSLEELTTPDDNQSFIGVFNGSYIGLLALSLRAKGIFELHMWAKRGSDAATIAEAAFHVKRSLFKDLDAKNLFAMVAKKNYKVREMCNNVGLVETGAVMIKGTYGNRCIEWLEHAAIDEQEQKN
jgi:hypothetical protein